MVDADRCACPFVHGLLTATATAAAAACAAAQAEAEADAARKAQKAALAEQVAAERARIAREREAARIQAEQEAAELAAAKRRLEEVRASTRRRLYVNLSRAWF